MIVQFDIASDDAERDEGYWLDRAFRVVSDAARDAEDFASVMPAAQPQTSYRFLYNENGSVHETPPATFPDPVSARNEALRSAVDLLTVDSIRESAWAIKVLDDSGREVASVTFDEAVEWQKRHQSM
jgi:hypothetical protein